MKKNILSALLATLVLAACAPAPPTLAPPPPPPVSTTPTAKTAVPAREEAASQIAAHLRAGRSEAALEVIAQERRRRGLEEAFEEEYIQALRGLAAAGEKLFEAGEYDRCGRVLRALLTHYPSERKTAAMIGIARHDLLERLEICAERLMSRGLADYRGGNLPAAIDTWKKILVFHDAHDGAKRGIETAEIQLRNLRALQ